MSRQTKIIVTLGPATNSREAVLFLQDRGVDFVRVNMSHSSLADLEYFIDLAKEVGIPFMLDTEGSQIRSGELNQDKIYLAESKEIRIYAEEIVGDGAIICLRPAHILSQLLPGDILRLDFDTLILRISQIDTLDQGYITAKTVTAGYLGRNKGVVVDSGVHRIFDLPCLSTKDEAAIVIGLKKGVEYIAASFIRSGEYVDVVRSATQGKMKIISKIECLDALANLDDIIMRSDYLLIDRGDLSKEVSIEKIPILQNIILQKSRQLDKGVIVATNLLETMVQSRKPTRAEIHDIAETMMGGAIGLTLSAETAIGKYPFECVNMLERVIEHVENNVDLKKTTKREIELVENVSVEDYLRQADQPTGLISPHGGILIDRFLPQPPNSQYLESLPKIKLNSNQLMDVEQIGIGTFSPLTGFMEKRDLENVLDKTRLTNGVIWPLPIVLDVGNSLADSLKVGEEIGLTDEVGDVVAILHLAEKYEFSKEEMASKVYGTLDNNHPGVQMVYSLATVFLAGEIDLVKRRKVTYQEYALTPRQMRRLFAERGWAKVVGFHTRNVIHRSHEFIQIKALNDHRCDGLFVHPIIGKKKKGDYLADFIIKSYELMLKNFYPKNKVAFATFGTFSRYAGPREALFTAICRKNFGCSHFIVGRDHTGVGNFYSSAASHEIFDQFPDLGIIPIKFGNVFYSKKLSNHVEEIENNGQNNEDRIQISGTQARKLFESGKTPPEWFMRVEISALIMESLNKGEQIFEE